MDYRLTAEDKERIKLLEEVSKNKFMNFSLEQLIRLQELVEKKQSANIWGPRVIVPGAGSIR